MVAESDAEIVRKTLAGNRHAFEALILRYNRMAYAVAFAQLGNHQDAEDMVQEGWLLAFSKLDHLREPSRFPAWLASIIRHVSINSSRNKWRRRSLEEVGDSLMVDFRENLEDADMHRALWAQVATMSPEFREVLTLHYHAGLTTEEIAEWTGLTRESVKKRLQRARSALSEQTLQTLLKPAEREEDNRRKRVMSLLLLLPVDWKTASSAPAGELSPRPRLALTVSESAGKPQWPYVTLALVVGVAVVTLAVYWLWPSPPDDQGQTPVQVNQPIQLPPPVQVGPQIVVQPVDQGVSKGKGSQRPPQDAPMAKGRKGG